MVAARARAHVRGSSQRRALESMNGATRGVERSRPGVRQEGPRDSPPLTPHLDCIRSRALPPGVAAAGHAVFEVRLVSHGGRDLVAPGMHFY